MVKPPLRTKSVGFKVSEEVLSRYAFVISLTVIVLAIVRAQFSTERNREKKYCSYTAKCNE